MNLLKIPGLFLFLFLASCSDNQKTVNLRFYDINGLKEKDKVFIKGVEIGEVKSIKINNDSIFVSISIEKKLELPVDSEFKIYTVDILGTKAINIRKGFATELLDDNYIVEVKQEKFSFCSDFVLSLRKLNVQKTSLNRYCIGIALLNKDVKKNKFKSKLLAISKINGGENYAQQSFIA